MIQVWINKDTAENAAALTIKLNDLVKARSGGRDLANDKILDLLRGIVVFVDENRKAEATGLSEKQKIEHAGVAYVTADKFTETTEGHGIPPNSKNIVYVIKDSVVTEVFLDLKAADFAQVVAAYEASLTMPQVEPAPEQGQDQAP